MAWRTSHWAGGSPGQAPTRTQLPPGHGPCWVSPMEAEHCPSPTWLTGHSLFCVPRRCLSSWPDGTGAQERKRAGTGGGTLWAALP